MEPCAILTATLWNLLKSLCIQKNRGKSREIFWSPIEVFWNRLKLNRSPGNFNGIPSKSLHDSLGMLWNRFKFNENPYQFDGHASKFLWMLKSIWKPIESKAFRNIIKLLWNYLRFMEAFWKSLQIFLILHGILWEWIFWKSLGNLLKRVKFN